LLRERDLFERYDRQRMLTHGLTLAGGLARPVGDGDSAERGAARPV